MTFKLAEVETLSAPRAEPEGLRLSDGERARRETLETVVRLGLKSWLEVGNALADIRDEQLYRETHRSFEEYCRETFGVSINYAGRLVLAARTVSDLQAALPLLPEAALPANEAQARELARAPAWMRSALWENVASPAGLTATVVRERLSQWISELERLPETERQGAFEEARALAGEEPLSWRHLRAAVEAVLAVPPAGTPLAAEGRERRAESGDPDSPRPPTGSKRPKNMGAGHSDEFQTPPEALNYLLPYLPQPVNSDGSRIRVWECAHGQGQLARQLSEAGYQVVASDVREGRDFLTSEPEAPYDLIVSNPPYTLKDAFLARAYALGKPFAFLLPLTALEGQQRQPLYREHGLEVVVLPERIHFTTPTGRTGKKSSPWAAVAWFTRGLGIGNDLTFANRATAEGKELRAEAGTDALPPAPCPLPSARCSRCETVSEEPKEGLLLAGWERHAGAMICPACLAAEAAWMARVTVVTELVDALLPEDYPAELREGLTELLCAESRWHLDDGTPDLLLGMLAEWHATFGGAAVEARAERRRVGLTRTQQLLHAAETAERGWCRKCDSAFAVEDGLCVDCGREAVDRARTFVPEHPLTDARQQQRAQTKTQEPDLPDPEDEAAWERMAAEGRAEAERQGVDLDALAEAAERTVVEKINNTPCARCGAPTCGFFDPESEVLSSGSRLDPRGHLLLPDGRVYCRACRSWGEAETLPPEPSPQPPALHKGDPVGWKEGRDRYAGRVFSVDGTHAAVDLEMPLVKRVTLCLAALPEGFAVRRVSRAKPEDARGFAPARKAGEKAEAGDVC